MIPVVESCAPCSLPITLFLHFILPAGVSYPGGSSTMIKKVSIALSHYSINAEDCSKISVFTFFLAIITADNRLSKRGGNMEHPCLML